jgi:hypothetical protein
VRGKQGRQVRKGAIRQGGCYRQGEGYVVEERVTALTGEDLDAVVQFEDLPHGRVAGRDDPAFGIAVSGFLAGKFRDSTCCVPAESTGKVKRQVVISGHALPIVLRRC